MYKAIKIPVKLIIPRKTKADKTYYLNMNGYRNWHFIISNQLKVLFVEQINEQIKDLKIEKLIKINYALYFKDKRVRDKMNYIAVIDKFFMDSLVTCGCIKDDNDKYTGEVHIDETQKTEEESYCLIDLYYDPAK